MGLLSRYLPEGGLRKSTKNILITGPERHHHTKLIGNWVFLKK
jgi:hypothetical protein